MDFVMGLSLIFSDNATEGLKKAVSTLEKLTKVAEDAGTYLNKVATLSALSDTANKIGSSFLSAGSSIISMLGQVVGKVNETGQTLMYAEMQLNKLYEGSGKTGKDVLSEIQQYAKTSIFEFEDLIPVVTSLKSVGIEAFDSIATSTGSANQTLMDYAADLASFAPQMKNVYGTGIQAAMGAIREYVAEGNARSLKSGAGIDITGILGEDKGATIQERTQQVADLIDKLGMVGMTASMAETPMVKLSNMGDMLFQLLGKISESGVYDKFNSLITKLADYVGAIPEDELESIAKTIGSALTTIMTPLEWVVDKIISLADCIRNLVKNNPEIAKLVTIAVALSGGLLVLGGVAFKIIGALASVSVLLFTMGESFSSLGTLIKTGSKLILSKILPLAGAMAILFFAWKNDFGGMRTFISNFVRDFVTTIELLSEAWNDNTLSDESFKLMEKLGLKPLITGILMLKYRFEFFKKGFIKGWNEITEKVSNAIKGVLDKVDGTFLEPIIGGLGDFLQKLASGDTEAWYQFGESFAEFTANAVALFLVLKGFEGILSIFVKLSKVGTVFKGIWQGLKGIGTFGKNVFKIFGKIGDVFSKVFPNISEIFSAIGQTIKLVTKGGQTLEVALQTAFTPLAGVVSVVIGSVTAIISFFSMLKNGFSWVKEIFMVLGIALAAVGAIILGAPALVAGIVAGIVALVATLVVVIKQNWAKICQFFSTIGNWIYTNIIAPIVNFFTTYIFPIISKIIEIVKKVIEIIVVLAGVFINWIKTNVIDKVFNFFSGLWSSIVEKLTPYIEKIKEIFGTIVNWVKEHVIDKLAGFFSGLWEGIQFAFGVVADTISGVLKGAINTVLQFICGVINGVINGINGAIDVINAIPGVSITKIDQLQIPQLAQGGIVDKPTLSIVGEAGKEAVMPLENNTGWITSLAHMIAGYIEHIRPAGGQVTPIANNPTTNNQRYLTSNNNTTTTVQGDTDNSVVFNQGAIQITVQNASEEEATRMAKKIMEYIKRKTELDRMMSYA